MKHLVKILTLGAAVAVAPLAHATLISIGLQTAGVNGGALTTVANDSGSGYASFSGAYGSTFSFNSISGTGAPILSPGTLNTTSLQVSSAATATTTITIYITEQGLTSPTGLTNALSSFTSNAFGGNAISVVESTLFSASNQLYAGVQMGSASFTGLGTSAIMSSAVLNGTYSETVKYVVTVGSGASNVNDTINITAAAAATPEPSSLIMLGTGLMSAAGMLVRRRKIS